MLDDDVDNRRVWNSNSVNLAIQGLYDGYELIESPFNKKIKDAQLRKANLPFKYTDDELKILSLCMEDKIFYGNSFGHLKTPSGWKNIELRPYQEELLRLYTEHRWNIIMFPRQSGKTTTTIIDIAHFLTFNYDKDMAVIAQSTKVVEEIMAKLKQFFDKIPFFLQPGFVKFTEDKIITDNNNRLTIGVASESVIQGFSLNYLYVDEVAYIRNAMWDKFWNNVYPTLSADPNSRVIITSTPKGKNHFHSMWNAAINHLSEFVAYRIRWTDVPRDISLEEFKRQTIANSSLEAWYMGYECSFDVGLKNIFSTGMQLKLRKQQEKLKDKWIEDPENPIYKSITYNLAKTDDTKILTRTDVPINYENDYVVFSVDIGEGLGLDKSVLKCNKIAKYPGANRSSQKKFKFIQFGTIYSNVLSIQEFAQLTLDTILCFKDPSRIRIVVENNTYGAEYILHLKNYVLHNKRYFNIPINIILAKFIRPTIKNPNNREVGIRWNAESKRIGIKYFRDLVEGGQLESTEYNTIEEYLNFGLQENLTYKANYGNDDLVMSDVSLAYFASNRDESVSTQFMIEAIEYLDLPEDDELMASLKKEEFIYTRNGFTLRQLKGETDSKKLDEEVGFIYM